MMCRFFVALCVLVGLVLGPLAGTALAEDTTPPELTSFSITPTEVDTGSADQTVTFTVTVTDAQSGVNSVGGLMVPLVGTQALGIAPCRISGDANSGVYVGTSVLPRWSTPGEWRVQELNLLDALGNSRQYRFAELETLFGQGCASIVNTAASADTTPPELTSFSITPTEVDTGSADQTVTFTVTVTDAQSGVNSVGGLMVPLVGTQALGIAPCRISGDANSGVYVGTSVLPVGSKEGLWCVQELNLVDMLGNSVQFRWDDLESYLPIGEDGLVANTAEARQVTIDRDWTIASARSSVTFSAGTVVTRADASRFAFYQLAAQEFTLDDSIPAADLDGTPLATLRLGIPGLNMSFSKPVAISMQVGAAYDGYRLLIQSLREGAEAWADETIVTVSDGRIQFTVTHATRFAACRAPALIKGLSPRSAKRRAVVTIAGEGFGKQRGTSYVKFGTKKVTRYLAWSKTRIKARVPATAKIGKLKVVVVTKAGKSNSKTFKVKR